jgi:drug/metabolite transporter (DMT)-like permease
MPVSLPVLILFVSSIGWGLTWLPLDYLGKSGVQGPLLILVAFGGAVVFLLPVLLIQYKAWRPQWQLLGLIVIFGGFANLAFQTSLYHGEVIRVMILFYLLPVWGVLGGRIFLGERIDALRVTAVIAALGGAFLILDGPDLIRQLPGWVDLLALGSGFAFAMNNLVFRFAQDIPVGSKVSAMFIGVVIFISVYLLFFEPDSSGLTVANVGLTLLYGIAGITLITFGTQWGVTQLEAGRASIIMVMELVAAIVSAVWLLNQSLGAMELTGIALVMSAALIEGMRGSQVAEA